MGKVLVDAAVHKTVEFLEEMIAGKHREVLPHVYSRDMDPNVKQT